MAANCMVALERTFYLSSDGDRSTIKDASARRPIRVDQLALESIRVVAETQTSWISADGHIALLLAGNDLIIQPVGRAGKIVVKNYAPGLFGLDLPEFGEEGGGGGGSGNHAPVVQEPVTDLTGTQNQLLMHILPETLFTDPDGNPLTYTLTLADDAALPDWLAFDPETRTLSGTPGNEDMGSLDALSFAVTLADGSALPAWLTFDAATRTLSGTPGAGEIGDLSLKVTASDGSLSASQTFVLTVQNVNDAPEAVGSIPAQSAKEGEAFSLTLPESLFVDPDAGFCGFTAGGGESQPPAQRHAAGNGTGSRDSGSGASGSGAYGGGNCQSAGLWFPGHLRCQNSRIRSSLTENAAGRSNPEVLFSLLFKPHQSLEKCLSALGSPSIFSAP
jgi:hypothetical protein